MDLTWVEFFAGGGMARLGLGDGWRCILSNEWDPKKARAYRAFFGAAPELIVDDVAKVGPSQISGRPDLAWASFPCQDLSLAGPGAGLRGERSGTFWPFWRLMEALVRDERKPSVIVLENVVGAVTSHGGKDLQAIVRAATDAGYRVGALVIDAVRFLPQSRPRLFIVASDAAVSIPPSLISSAPSDDWHPRAIRDAFAALPARLQESSVWWTLPAPPPMRRRLASFIESDPQGVDWHSPSETRYLLSLMSDLNRDKVRDASRSAARRVGTVYRRTRLTPTGKAQRAEVRFDGISGCLRTPAGGSSRQAILVVEGARVRSRLLSPREAARLMGVPDSYPLPSNYNDAYHLFGDGLAVPVVAWLERHLLRPLAAARHVAEAA